MGRIANKFIAVSGPRPDLQLARKQAKGLFGAIGMARLVTLIAPHALNGGCTFFIAPDGSKEGWNASDDWDRAATDFRGWLQNSGVFYTYAMYNFGGDDELYSSVWTDVE